MLAIQYKLEKELDTQNRQVDTESHIYKTKITKRDIALSFRKGVAYISETLCCCAANSRFRVSLPHASKKLQAKRTEGRLLSRAFLCIRALAKSNRDSALLGKKVHSRAHTERQKEQRDKKKGARSEVTQEDASCKRIRKVLRLLPLSPLCVSRMKETRRLRACGPLLLVRISPVGVLYRIRIGVPSASEG